MRFFAALLLLLAVSAEAANKTWLSAGGANSTNWNRANNWSPSGAPAAADDIIIPTTPANGTGFPVLNATSTIATLNIQTGASLTGAAGQGLTVTGAATVTGTLNVNASTMSVGSLAGGGTVNGNTGTLNVRGNMTVTSFTAGTGTVVFNGTAAQNIGVAYTFNNLTITNTSAAVTSSAGFSVAGNLTMNGAGTALNVGGTTVSVTGTLGGTGTVNGNTGTLNIGGAMTVSTFNRGTGTVVFNGTAAQNVGAYTFNNLTINNANGVTLSAGNTGVAATLTLTSGVVTTGANTLITTANCPGSVSRAAGHVAGLLQLHVPTGSPSCTFDVGGPTSYRPIALVFTSVTNAGDLTGTVTQSAGEHLSIATSGIDSAIDVNRYWTLTNSGIALTSYDATFTFVAGDVDGGADPTTFEIERWDGAAWNTTTVGTRTATTTNATGITAFSDFVSGKKKGGFTAATGSFNVFETATAANAVTGVIKTKIAGTGFSLDVVAIVGGAQFNGFNDSVTVDLIGNNTTGVALDATNCPTSSSTVLASFTASITNGRSTIAFAAPANSWRDVRARVRWPTAAPTVTNCSTDNFAVRPDSLAIAASDATWETAGTARLLNNTVATGGNVHKASTSAAGAGARPFTLRATAAPATATNYDGTPTVVAGFPACGALCPAAVGGLTFSGAWGGIANSGVRENATANYSEAGTFTLQLEDATYANVDSADSTALERTVPSTATVQVGRFVPDRFVFSAPSTPLLQTFGSSCASRSFTYVGQRFWFATLPTATLSAVNAAGATTTNYPMTTTKPTLSESYSDSGVPAANTSGVGTPTLGSVSSGAGTYSAASAGTLVYTRDASTPVAPFNATGISLSVSASDADDNAANQGTITTPTPLAFNGIGFDSGSEFRYGRMRLFNASGPTTVDIPLTLRAEYYQSAAVGFVVNSADNCTPLDAGYFKLSNQTGSLTAGNMADSHVSVPASLTSGIASGMKLLKASPAASGAGSVRICFDLDSAPAVGDTACQRSGSTSADRAYLQGPWSGGSNDKDPNGQINVGTFGAQPNNFIFFRENY